MSSSFLFLTLKPLEVYLVSGTRAICRSAENTSNDRPLKRFRVIISIYTYVLNYFFNDFSLWENGPRSQMCRQKILKEHLYTYVILLGNR